MHDLCVIVYWAIRARLSSSSKQYAGAWLVCERGIEARDNGFAFFKYMREHYPNKEIYYLIDPKEQNDYQNVQPYGHVISYNSAEHRKAIFYAECMLSTHVGFITPWSYVCHKAFLWWLHCPRFVLLNHGITKEDMSDKLNKRVTGVDLFIAANEQDRAMIVNDDRYGYSAEEVVLTGYARYDRWQVGKEKEQILLMPTWRAYLVQKSIQNRNTPKVVDGFVESDYYNAFQRLLQSSRLDDMLNQSGMTLVFYPHYEMQSALHQWTTNSKHIVFGSKQEYDIPTLMRESKVLVTDYSGVGFDFAYMYKPVLYYQFDQAQYYASHYQRSEAYNMADEGLGQVVETEQALLDALEQIIKAQCAMPAMYKERVNAFFTYHDNDNCARIYEAVMRMLGH